MPLFTKPQFNNVWASTGVKLTPDVAKISQGWVVEIPPHEFDNWMQNRQDALLAHLNQLGIPQWDSTVEYQAGKSYVQGTTAGIVYKALTTHSNVNPETDIQNNWTVAFEPSGSALLKVNNLADVPDKAQARINLGIATTEFYDARYLVKTANFSDVPNKATARNNLGLGNSATLDIGTTASTVASGDDSRIVNAVQTSRQISSGAGLVGGGNLASDRVLSLGTPSSITRTSSNNVSTTSHSHSIDLTSILPTTVTDVTGARTYGVNYTNNYGKHIYVTVVVKDPNAGNVLGRLFVNNIQCSSVYSGRNFIGTVSCWVPPSATYRVERGDVDDIILSWVEIV